MVAGTVENDLAAIKWKAACCNWNYPDQRNTRQLKLVMDGFKRHSQIFRPRKCKEVFSRAQLQQFLQELASHYHSNQPLVRIQRAIFTAGFWAMMRIGEYATLRVGETGRAQRSTLKWLHNRSVSFRLSASKTDPTGERSGINLLFVCAPASQAIDCPYHALEEYLALEHSDNETGALFQRLDHKCICQHTVRNWLASPAAVRVWGDSLPSSHSFRASGATHRIHMGESIETVERCGRWASGSRALRSAYILIKRLLGIA